MIMLRNTHIITLLCVLCAASSCTLFGKRSNGVVAEYDGQTITQSDIDYITAGLSSEDSARVADAYIRQWATALIEYNEAKDVPNKNIEQLVEDYRHSLYIHDYEERLIAQRMPKQVEDTLVAQFYETHTKHFVLRETILRGVLLVVPNGAPNMDKLKHWLQEPTDEANIESIEKYAYQYATGYELFVDEWKTANQILMRMPFKEDDFLKQLNHKKQIELQDSISTYLLQVTDIHATGEAMPLDYATPEIEKIILNQRQVEFLKQERDALYDQALREHKLKFPLL